MPNLLSLPVGAEVAAGSDAKTFDTRSFIVSRPQLQETPAVSQQRLQVKEDIQSALARTVQARYTHRRDSLRSVHL